VFFPRTFFTCYVIIIEIFSNIKLLNNKKYIKGKKQK